MKLFLIGMADVRQKQLEAVRLLAKEHDIQYWLRQTDHFPVDPAEFPTTVFHDYLDALKAIPAPGIDVSLFEPWSSADIISYAAEESEYMTMADKWYPSWSVNQRKELFYEMLRYWGGLFECIVIYIEYKVVVCSYKTNSDEVMCVDTF